MPWGQMGSTPRDATDDKTDYKEILLTSDGASFDELCEGMYTLSNQEVPHKEPQGLMEVIRMERPFQKVGIDVLGPFPVTTDGNVNIIVAVDYLTKWVETRAMRTATAREAAEFFVEDIVLRHGAPESVAKDFRKCVIADFTKEIMRLMEVDHRTTTPYNPQANGLVKRLNHTLADMLSIYINSTHTNWDVILP